LGVRPSDHYSFIVWASPVGPYFKSGVIKPIDLLVTTDVHRAPPKGSGHVKAIGNYAPVFKTQQEAKKKGFSEVVFLDARFERFVEEAGASNFFCYTEKDNTLHTPSLGAILEGVTRDSVLKLAKDSGINVSNIELLSYEIVLDTQWQHC
jgi:branched-chain amino acid aminotransferase